MKNLTKFQKIIILITIFWEIFVYRFNLGYRNRLDFRDFILASSPVIIYWSVVWVFGFGTFKKLFGNVFYKMMDYKNKSVATSTKKNEPAGNHTTKKEPADSNTVKSKSADNHTVKNDTGSSISFLIFGTFILYFITGYATTRLRYTDPTFCLGSAIASLVAGLIVFFIMVILTCFVKDVEKRNKRRSILFFIVSLMLCSGNYFRAQEQSELDRRHAQNLKQQLVNVAAKGGEVNREDFNEINSKLVRAYMTSIYDAIGTKLPQYLNDTHLSGILQEQDELKLLKSRSGVRTLYERGGKIIAEIDKLDIEADIKNIYIQVAEEAHKNCKMQALGMRDTLFCDRQKAGYLFSLNVSIMPVVEQINKKRKLVHSEYDIIKCLYKYSEKEKCRHLFEKYLKEESEFQKDNLKLQEDLKNKAISSIENIPM